MNIPIILNIALIPHMDSVWKLSKLQKHNLQFANISHCCFDLQFKNLNLKIHNINL